MEVLGTGSAILAVAELSLRLFEACDAYYQTVKGASNEIKTLRDHAGVFNTALKALNALATSSDAGKVPILAEWMQDGGPRDECAELLTDLLAKLAKQGDRKEKHSWLKNLDWPLKKEDMENGINTIGSHRESLVMALGSDNLTVSLDTNRVATMIRDDIAIKERENLLQKMLKWIPAVDTSVNHKEARRKHQAGTGDWLFQLEEFSKWKTTRGSVMWLSGMLGCGKTILSSTAIEHLLEHCKTNTRSITIHFYFDFSSDRNADNFVASLIQQLVHSLNDFPEALADLFEKHSCGKIEPSLPDLLVCLHRIIDREMKNVEDVFLVIDAVDEAPAKKDVRQKVLETIRAISGWTNSKMHTLITSRRETDIVEALKEPWLTIPEVSIDNEQMKSDISCYVSTQIREDKTLGKLAPKVAMRVERTLTEKANGMFRWAYCQITTLRRCKTLPQIDAALRDLPLDLRETYARILQAILKEDTHFAYRALMWLMSSDRDLTADELAEASVVDPRAHVSFEVDNRLLRGGEHIREILGALVTSEPSTDATIRLAHFSVKEYLKSQESGGFRIRGIDGRRFVDKACVSYLYHVCELLQEEPKVASDIQSAFPLIWYILGNFPNHVRDPGMESSRALTQVFFNMAKNDELRSVWEHFWPDNVPETGIARMLYAACGLGLVEVARALIEGSREGEQLVTATFESQDTLLHRAAGWRYFGITKLLIRHGADPNARDMAGFTPLYYGIDSISPSPFRRHDRFSIGYVLIPLLDHGADVNLACGEVTPLMLACEKGRFDKVQILINHGADVNKWGNQWMNPLRVAAVWGHDHIVRYLVQNFASVESVDSEGGSVLYCALYRRAGTPELEPDVIRTLLSCGARAEVVNKKGDTLLHCMAISAVFRSKEQIPHNLDIMKDVYRILVENGADRHRKNDNEKTALDVVKESGDQECIAFFEQAESWEIEARKIEPLDLSEAVYAEGSRKYHLNATFPTNLKGWREYDFRIATSADGAGSDKSDFEIGWDYEFDEIDRSGDGIPSKDASADAGGTIRNILNALTEWRRILSLIFITITLSTTILYTFYPF